MATDEPRSLKVRAVSAVWWSGAEIAVRYGVQFVVTIILARLLAPADFGLIAMLLVFTTLAALLAEGGLGSALIQRQNTTADDETTAFIATLSVACLLATVLGLAAPWIARFYSEPRLVALLRVLVWVLPLGALATVPHALLSKRLDFKTRVGAEVCASVGSATLALWLAWRGYGASSLVWQAVSGAALRALSLWALAGWHPKGRFRLDALSRLLGFGGFLLLAGTLSMGAVRLQSLMIGRLFDARTLGFYALAQDTQQAPAQLVTSLLNRVGLPVFSSVAVNAEHLASVFGLALRVSMFLFFPAMVCLAVTAQPLVQILYGSAWTPAGPLLVPLALAASLWPLHVLNLAALSACGRTDVILRLEVMKAAISVPLVLAAAIIGVEAVAWSVLAGSVASMLINTMPARSLLRYGAWEQLSDLLPIVVASALAGGLAWWSGSFVSKPFAKFAVICSLMFGIYIALCAAFRLRGFDEFIRFIKGSGQAPTTGEGG